MKKICLLMVLFFCATVVYTEVSAQNDDVVMATDRADAVNPNCIINVFPGEITYTPKTKDTKTSSKVLDVIASVAAGEFTEDYDGYADAVRAEILRGLSQTYRLRVLDREFDKELDDSKYSIIIDGVIANIATTTKVRTEEVKDKNGNKKKVNRDTYDASIVFTLNLKDVNTQKILNSNTFKVSSSELASDWFATKQGAMDKAVSYVARVVCEYYDHAYPLTATILELGLAKHDKQKELYIDLGSKQGVYEGLTFGVYKIKKVAGRDAHTYLGRIKIKKVEGEEVSFCKVVSGGKDIKKCLENNEPLLIISRH